MKKRSFLSFTLALTIAGLLTSCDLFDKADDISLTRDLTKSFNVSAPTDASYSGTFTIDALSDPEINKYKEKITEVKINKITYKVSNFVGSLGTTFSGNIAFESSPSTFNIVAAIPSLNLADASNAGTSFDLDFSSTDVSTIAGLLKNDKSVDVLLNGDLSAVPTSFTIEVTINATITADAL